MPTAKQFRRIALSLPEAEERETWGQATFRVREKMFALMSADGVTASVKATKVAQDALIASDPSLFFRPPYVGVHGWVGVRLAKVDHDELRELITEAWLLTAPKRVTREFEI